MAAAGVYVPAAVFLKKGVGNVEPISDRDGYVLAFSHVPMQDGGIRAGDSRHTRDMQGGREQ